MLVGTQMIAKGHDFPGVTLVGVVGADAALSLPDFRAAERTFQLLTQVAGRSGRGDRPGEVLIQSYFPDHYTFQLACTQRFEDFYARESRYRKAMFYPPFTALAGIMVSDRDAGRARAHRARSRRVSRFASIPGDPDTRSRSGATRTHQARSSSSASDQVSLPAQRLHDMLERLQAHIEEKKITSTKVIVDVDPVSLL